MGSDRQWLLAGFVALGAVVGEQVPHVVERERPRSPANVGAAASARADALVDAMPRGFGLSGRGVVVGIWDQGAARITHEDLAGRVLALDGANAADHSTHVAGTIAGTGTSQPAARGIAPAALLWAHDWSLDEVELRERAPFLAVSTHAYGARMGWALDPACSGAPSWLGRADENEDRGFGKYGAEARAIDAIAYETGLLTVWAAGNERQDVGASGEPHFHFPDCGTTHSDTHLAELDTSYDTIGVQLAAKNALVIGATAHVDVPRAQAGEITVLPFSSFGPMDDGRIKPDVVASGALIYSATASSDDAHASFSGSSSSAAVVAGTIALLTEHHRVLHGGVDLAAEAMRALVLHTATPVSDHGGPSYAAGYGALDAKSAAELISADAKYAEEGLRQLALGSVGEDGRFEVETVPLAAGEALRITLAWLDPPGVVNEGGIDDATPALVNDLDLELIAPDGETIRYPWSLDGEEPAAASTRSRPNRTDNAEVVDVDAADAGVWTVRVSPRGRLFRGRAQRFALVASVPFHAPTIPVLAAPRSVVIEAVSGERPQDTTVALHRDGAPISIQARTSAAWLSVVGDEHVAPGSLTLRVTRDDLREGLHFATVVLEHEDPLGPHAIGVVVRVSCEPDCSDRACGLDPVCGTACGGCGAGEYCDASARCASWTAGCPAADLGSAPGQLVALGSTQGAGNDSEGTCGGEGAEDIAFAWTAPQRGIYRIGTGGSTTDTVLYVRDADCEGAELACNDDTGDATSALSVSLDAGQRIVIVVDGAAEPGGFHLSIQRDVCPDAELGSRLGTAVATGSTAASTDRVDGACSERGARDAAFAWSAPEAAVYTFSTVGSRAPHAIHVRDATCAGDDLGCSGDSPSEVVLELERGQRVIAVVESARDSGGPFQLSITSSEGVCAGSCDGTPNQGACYCDAACVAEGDCCEDACSTCGSCTQPARCETEECRADPCRDADNGTSCDDGDACTTHDRCIGGRCSGIASTCAASDDAGAALPQVGADEERDVGRRDAGQVVQSTSEGCGCRIARATSSRGASLAILVLFALAVRRSRRSKGCVGRLAIVLGLIATGCPSSSDDLEVRGDGHVDEGAGGAGGQVDDGPSHAAEHDAGASRDGRDAASPSPLSCGEGDCDLLDALSCQDGLGCKLTVEDESEPPLTRCLEAGGGRDGDACEAPSDCSEGLDCTSFDGDGVCRRYCCALNTTSGCPRGQFCRIGLEAMSTATGVALCDACEGCDLADAAACGGALGCYPVGDGCAACLRAGTKAVGQRCEAADDCVPGSACLAIAEERRCMAFCSSNGIGSCQADHSCQLHGVFGTDTGVCLQD